MGSIGSDSLDGSLGEKEAAEECQKLGARKSDSVRLLKLTHMDRASNP